MAYGETAWVKFSQSKDDRDSWFLFEGRWLSLKEWVCRPSSDENYHFVKSLGNTENDCKAYWLDHLRLIMCLKKMALDSIENIPIPEHK